MLERDSSELPFYQTRASRGSRPVASETSRNASAPDELLVIVDLVFAMGKKRHIRQGPMLLQNLA